MYKQIQIDIINHLMLANKLPDEELQLIELVIDIHMKLTLQLKYSLFPDIMTYFRDCC